MEFPNHRNIISLNTPPLNDQGTSRLRTRRITRLLAALLAGAFLFASCNPPTGSKNGGGTGTGTGVKPSDECSTALGFTCPEFEEAYIKSSEPKAFDNFGGSIALSGDTLAVGVIREDSLDGGKSDVGGVYIFTRTGTGWSQQARIHASNADTADWFGNAVALSGDTLVVGASNESSNSAGVNPSTTITGGPDPQADNTARSSGAVYVFTRSGSTWNQRAYIKASNTGVNDWFGSSVALSGNTLAVGAGREDSHSTGVNPSTTITGGADPQDDNSFSGTDSGAVYVFTRSGTDNTTWTQQAYIKASNTDREDYFGRPIALSGDTLAVGATGEDNATGTYGNQSNNNLSRSGAVYVFTRSAGTWSQEQYLKASNPGEQDRFGGSLALSGDTLAVGAQYEDSGSKGVDGDQGDNITTGKDSGKDSGAVYIFTRSGTTWNHRAYIKASNAGGGINDSGRFLGDEFGYSLALSGDTLVVGAPFEWSNAKNVNGDQKDNSMLGSGAVYFFTRSGGSWSQKAYIKASNPDGADGFGASAALAGNTLAVGATGESSNAAGVNGNQADNSISGGTGAVYVRRIAP